ncbi:MAG: EF-hand domain-containing protein [Alphaproteobacteria bacterium]|nr:EF-hand domain-containing protein [Alphaproteobacteria bacterium]
MKVSKTKSILIAGGIGMAALVAGAGVGMAKSGPGGWGGWGHHGPHGHGGPHLERMIGQIDTNGDGNLTVEEIASFRDARFQAMDADSNGELTPRELTEGFRALHFAAMDSDGDGLISQDEFMAAGKDRNWGGKRFSWMDEDGNGRLNPAEMAAMSERLMSRLDANEDGIIDADELQQMRDRHHR